MKAEGLNWVGTRGLSVPIAGLLLLTGCQQSAQGKQLDANYASTTGVGSLTASGLSLPHGRYTFFSYADPPECVQSVKLLDSNGRPVVDDGPLRQPAPSMPPDASFAPSQQMVPTTVQHELVSGRYRLKVTAKSGCAWEVQQILNYILSDETPLKAERRPVAPSLDVTIGNSSDTHFHISVAGIYHVRSSVTPCDRFSVDLVRPGSVEHLAAGTAASLPPGSFTGPQTTDAPFFLGAGDWAAMVSTRCYWRVEVTPWRGSLGGGSEAFAA